VASITPARILVLQNMMKPIIDFKAIRRVARVPVHHVWASNWNTFFYLTYVVMVFMPEPSSLIYYPPATIPSRVI
jgi:hypothetical protein